MKPVELWPGQRLRQLREHRGISQGQIAEAIGVSVGSIQNYEHGRVAITIDRLVQLARALQCEPADLLRPPGSPPPRCRSATFRSTAGEGAAGTQAARSREGNP